MRNGPLRTLANATLFGGWMLPVILARLVPERLGAAGPQASRMFYMIGGIWGFAALVYGVVLASRVRRGIVD